MVPEVRADKRVGSRGVALVTGRVAAGGKNRVEGRRLASERLEF